MRMTASPSLTALTRQSTRFSQSGSMSTVCVSESFIGLRQSPGKFQRHADLLLRP